MCKEWGIDTISAFICMGTCRAAWIPETYSARTPTPSQADDDGWTDSKEGGKWRVIHTAKTTGTEEGQYAKVNAKSVNETPGSVLGGGTYNNTTATKRLAYIWDDNPTSTPAPACVTVGWTCAASGSSSCGTDGYWQSHQSLAKNFGYGVINTNIDSSFCEWFCASNSACECPLKSPDPANNTNVTDAKKESDKLLGQLYKIAEGAIVDVAQTAMKTVSQMYVHHSSLRSASGGEVAMKEVSPGMWNSLLPVNKNESRRLQTPSSPIYVELTQSANAAIEYGGPSAFPEYDARAEAESTVHTTSFNLTVSP